MWGYHLGDSCFAHMRNDGGLDQDGDIMVKEEQIREIFNEQNQQTLVFEKMQIGDSQITGT